MPFKPANEAMTLPLFSLMITVEVTPKATPLAEQPSRICGAGPIVSPCGPEQELSGTVKFATIDCVTGESTKTEPATESFPGPLTSGTAR